MLYGKKFIWLLDLERRLHFDAQKTRFRALDDWFNTPQGIDIAEYFSAELNQLNGLLHGETLLQLGSFGKNCWLNDLPFIHKWKLTPYLEPTSTLISSFYQLPIDRNSLDCIIAPLILDSFKKNPLDEIDRILKPMGQVVFFGVNPLSIWGLYLRLRPYSSLKFLTTKSVFSLQRAMLHRGYCQGYLSTFYYIPPLSSRTWLDKFEILNEIGKMISPCPAGFYCLVMQKQQVAHPDLLLTETETLWSKKRSFQPSCFSEKK